MLVRERLLIGFVEVHVRLAVDYLLDEVRGVFLHGQGIAEAGFRYTGLPCCLGLVAIVF